METTSFAQGPLTVSTLASLRSVYLQRLARLQRLRRQHQRELNHRGRRLLDRSAFAAYCACREIGAEREALAILRGSLPEAAAETASQLPPSQPLNY